MPTKIYMWIKNNKNKSTIQQYTTVEVETRLFLKSVGLLKFYEEVTSLKGKSCLLRELIFCWDHRIQAFMVSLNLWYHPIEEDIYFMTRLSMREKDFPQFPNLPPDTVEESQLIYMQIYVMMRPLTQGIFRSLVARLGTSHLWSQ